MTATESDAHTRDLIRSILQRSEAAELGWNGSGAQSDLSAVAGAQGALRDLSRDRAEDATLRFKAYEALVGQGETPAAGPACGELARVYAAALRAAGDDGHDAFGFPGSRPSGAGARIVACGKDAVGPLLELADDETTLEYEGSEEPTIAELKGYRVKDLVAVWLAALTGQQFDVEVDDPADRDGAIAKLVAAAKRLTQ